LEAPSGNVKRLTRYQLDVVCSPYYGDDGLAITTTLEKARRIGGTTAGALRIALLALGRELRHDGTFVQHKPCDCWIVSKDWSGSKSFLKEVATCCDELAELDPDFRAEIHQTTILFPSTGKTITALPCSDKAIRGKTGALVLDEVAFFRQIEDVYGAAKLVAAPNLAEPRGYPVLAITTPWDSGSFAHRLFTDATLPFKRFRVDVHDAKRDGFPIDIERAIAELAIPELVQTELMAIWVHGGDSFFPADKLRRNTEDDSADESGRNVSGLPAGWQRARARFGIDCGGGRGRDFTAIVQWRLIDGVWWMVGLKASNVIPTVEMADIAADWILDTNVVHGSAEVEVRTDQGIMGLDFIRQLMKRLKDRKRTRVDGVSMMPADQERFAVAGRRLLERGQMKLYAGTDAGGDEHGAKALSLELSNLKARPGVGGRLTFATPRDPTKGHLDRAWAALIGLDEADDLNDRPTMPTQAQIQRMASGSRFGGASRGFG
jgi:hypothetical protein